MVVRVGHRARHAQGLGLAVGAGGGGDEGHLAVVVDLRQARHLAARELGDVVEEAVDEVLAGEPRQEGVVRRLVLGADRAQQDRAAVAQLRGLLERLRVGLDRQPVFVDGGRAQAHVGVEGLHAVLVDEHRVDVHLVDLGMVDDDLRDLGEGERERVAVGRGQVAARLEQRRRLAAGDEVVGERLVERRQADREAAEDLQRATALAEHDHRSEQAVRADADQQLARVAAHHHALHGEAAHRHGRLGAPGALDHAARGDLDRIGALEVERDAADVPLAADVARHQGQRHRQADAAGDLRRLFRAGGEVGLDDRHAVGREHVLGFGFGQAGARFGERALDHRAGARDVGLERLGFGGRDLHKHLGGDAVAVHVQEGAGRMLG